jgi:DnaJ family protein C protein 7
VCGARVCAACVVRAREQEAQFLVRKSQRKDLYGVIGVKGVGSKASEKEIRLAYKKAALACHPDRFSDKSDEEKKAAEAQFKELGEALDILTDDFKRKLWDEGYDKEAVDERVRAAERAAREEPRGHHHHHHH